MNEIQSDNEIWPVYFILEKENISQKILQKLWPEKKTSSKPFCVCKELSNLFILDM